MRHIAELAHMILNRVHVVFDHEGKAADDAGVAPAHVHADVSHLRVIAGMLGVIAGSRDRLPDPAR
jgi:hypothetical protein